MVLGACFATALALTPLASAQDETLGLARLCVSEVGFPRMDDPGPMLEECAAIHTAVSAQAARQGLSLRDRLRTHRSIWSAAANLTRQPSRPWLHQLHPLGREPSAWADSTTVPWSRRRGAWGWLLEKARGLVLDPRTPCDGTPTTWGVGGAVVRYLAANPRGVRVDCGPTRNTFLRAR